MPVSDIGLLVTAYAGTFPLPVSQNAWDNVVVSGCLGPVRGDPLVFHTRAPRANVRVLARC